MDQEQFRVEAVVDRTNTTAQVFLGLTMGCARCHDHKYDPFSQREYYELFAFFNSDVEANVPAPLPGEGEEYRKRKAEYDKKLAGLQADVEAYRKNELPAVEAEWEAGLKLPDVRALPPAVREVLLIEPAKRDAAQAKAVADQYAKINPLLVKLNKELADHQKTAPQSSQAQMLLLGPPRKTHLLIRGDFLRPGVEVEPDVPAVLPPLPPPNPPPASGEGRVGAGRPTRLDSALCGWSIRPTR